MTALQKFYESDDDARQENLRVMIWRQEARQKQTIYPMNRSESRATGRIAAKEARAAEFDTRKRLDELKQQAADEYMAHVADWFADVHLRDLCESYGVEMPESDFGRHCVVARLTEAQWWGRQIRKADWRGFEAQQLRLGNVKHFVSNEIAQARTWHREALAGLLENLYAIRSDGKALMTLADLASRSTSNPANRRAEMIVRAKGLARWRAAQGFTWTFATITAPSKFHRMTTADAGGKSVLIPNKKWDGSTPRETQEYINGVWEKFRAQMDRAEIDWSAFRTVEPHADGTPHWHLCVMCRPEDRPLVKMALHAHAMREDRGEPGACEHRCTFEDYDPKDGSMEDMADRCVAYLIAYVSKNIDGMKTVKGPAQEAGDAFDTTDGKRVELGPMVESARRVEAWATTWGIRQFQELGGSRAVTAYRELRRLREAVTDGDIEPARAAADAGDYGAFIGAARGTKLKLWAEKSEDRLIAAAIEAGVPYQPSLELADIAIEQKLLNCWGEPARRWIMGILVQVPTVKRQVTREHTWEVVDDSEIESRAFEKCKAHYNRVILPLVMKTHSRGTPVQAKEVPALLDLAFAIAPGCFFSRAAQPRALGPVSITVRADEIGSATPLFDSLPESIPPPW